MSSSPQPKTAATDFLEGLLAFLRKLVDGERALRIWLIASLVCNMGIIVTGAVVRLTGSGLGCPTWPQCFEGSYVPHEAAGIHGAIEFGNRLLTFVLIAAALGAFISVWRNRGRGTKLWWLTLGIGLGIPFQGVIGGITVLTDLNPWVVAFHLLLSVALIVLCVWAVRLGYRHESDLVDLPGRVLAIVTFAVAMLCIWLGTIVTGAGPHAGDAGAARNGLDIEATSRIHALSAWALTGLSVLCVIWFRRGRHARATRAAWALVATCALQGAIGYLQYFMGLPIFVVVLHMLGLALVTAVAAWLLFATSFSQVSSGSSAMARNSSAR